MMFSPRTTLGRLAAGAALVTGMVAVTSAGPASAAIKPATTKTATATAPISPVAKVDVKRYLGSWYQLADLPQLYEVFCQQDVIATYSLNSDGTVKVSNRCTGPLGVPITVVGGAKVLDPGTNARLQVSFLNLFGQQIYSGTDPNYVIIGLASDYSWAVVGDPTHSTAYVLSRTPRISGATTAAVKAALVRSGYDPCSLTVTRQTGGASTASPVC